MLDDDGIQGDPRVGCISILEKADTNVSNNKGLDFPGGPVVKNLPANAGDMASVPGLGGSHMPWSNYARG